MKDNVAIITGATSGIGEATARAFAKNDIKVVLAGRNEKAGKWLEKELSKGGGEALFVKTDVADSQSVQSLISKTLKKFGQLDIAVNNAGTEGTRATLANLQEEEWDRVIDTNLKGLWLCMKHEILAMMEKGGAIVNVSSIAIRLREPKTSAYTASKAGVEALTQVAAVEYGPQGIRINSIQPGAVDTPMLRRIYSAKELAQWKKENPLGRIATPDDIAEAILWASSPKARHMNGASITIDGGG
jgi:NAD(P)-dependent dehydrogenase (short-subunit alcohol dehydrogenase family)